jgi:hypothetical protein
MWIEAVLAKEDLGKAVADLCPLTIRLGDDGRLCLSDPRNIELVAERGLRMSVTVEVHWPILGRSVPVSLRCVTLELRPEILRRPEGDTLTFRPELDGVDISMLPAIVDRGIVDLVNAELDKKHIELSWRFTDTLSHVFELPDTLVSARAIDLRAVWGKVKITSEALVLAVSFHAGVELRRGDPRPRPVLTRMVHASLPSSPSNRPTSIRLSKGLAWMAGGALLLGLGAWMVALLGRPRRRTLLARLRAYEPT